MTESIYASMGVGADKSSSTGVFKRIVKNDYPFAWVNITKDPRAPGFVRTIKIDGDGSEPTQHCLEYMETGDKSVFEASADDSHAMVTMDAAAAGFTEEYIFGDVLDRNKLNIPALIDKLVEAYARRIGDIVELHRSYGFDEEIGGGEIADLPSQTSSYICNGFLYARTHESRIISGCTQPGDMIWGLASTGQAIWEKIINSGIMANGITLAAAVLMWLGYNDKYPFLRHEKNKYRGRFRVEDRPDCLGGMTVSEAIRSPTRQWSILLKQLYDELFSSGHLHLLHGVSANTGGGNTKLLRLGENIRYVKKMPTFAPIFQLIMEEGNIPPEEMLEDFNNGVGFDLIGSDEGGYLERAISKVCHENHIDFFELGQCEKCDNPKNQAVITTDYGTFTYSGK